MELKSTMAKENSGVHPKFRTYGPPTASALGSKCHPANGGGATVDLSSDTLDYAKHTTGYYVGGLMPAETFAGTSRASAYLRALRIVWERTDGLGLVGFWEFGGVIHAEQVEHVEGLTEAVDRAQERGEDAIYGVTEGRSIFLSEV